MLVNNGEHNDHHLGLTGSDRNSQDILVGWNGWSGLKGMFQWNPWELREGSVPSQPA